jgi:hypothetical protein
MFQSLKRIFNVRKAACYGNPRLKKRGNPYFVEPIITGAA